MTPTNKLRWVKKYVVMEMVDKNYPDGLEIKEILKQAEEMKPEDV